MAEIFYDNGISKNFECAGYHCLTAKGLTLDIWSDSIEDGRKGDFLSLYGLNLMLDTHTVVHLSNGRLLPTIKNPPKNHDMLLALCNFHLVYLGRGLFVELIERKCPLIVVEETADVKTILKGELTFDESETLDRVINHGLSAGIDTHSMPSCTTSQCATSEMKNIIPIKEEPETDSESTTPLHKDETDLQRKYNLKTLEIKCNRLDVAKHLLSKDKNTHTPDCTVSIPDEKSHASTICNKSVRINLHKLDLKNALSIKLSPELLKKLYDKTDYDSDKTEDYWPMAEDHSTKFKAVLVNKPNNIKDIRTPSKRGWMLQDQVCQCKSLEFTPS